MEEKNSILIIDDSVMSTMALKEILEPDYDIHTAEDGKIGIEMAEKHNPDIILLDIIMPKLDGYGVLVALKKNKRTKSIPVMLISSLDDLRNEQKGFVLGAADYITKPFSPTVVKHRVKNQISIVNIIKKHEENRIIELNRFDDELTEAKKEINRLKNELISLGKDPNV